MDINLADVTLHIDEALNYSARSDLEDSFRRCEGVISVHFNQDRPHLVVLEYNPDVVRGRDLLDIVQYQGFHGEMIGL